MLATYIDGLVNRRWYRKLIAKQRDYREECLTEWQCFEFLYEKAPIIALAVDQLPVQARMATCLFLLFDHAIKSIESDATLLEFSKRELLSEFSSYLQDPTNFYNDTSRRKVAGDLLWHLDLLLNEFAQLPLRYRQVIKEGISRAADGLNQFLGHNTLNTASEYSLFCHHYGGILTITLARIFAVSGLESPLLGNEEHLSNAVGALSTKATLLTRFRELTASGVSKCPRNIWELYVKDGDTSVLMQPKHMVAMKFCVNHLVLDALRQLPDVYFLLSRLEDPQIFRLLAVDQVASIKLLAQAYGTDLSKHFAINTTDLANIYANLHGLEDFRMMLADELFEIKKKVNSADPTSGQMLVLLAQLELLCSRTRNKSLVILSWELTVGNVIEIALLTMIGAYLFHLVMMNWMSF